MSTGVVLALVVHEILHSGVPLKWKHFLCFISIARDLWRLMVLFAMPTAVALSQCIGILGWGCSRFFRVVLNIIPSWQFINNALSSASAADATTHLKIEHNVWNAPFSLIGLQSLGTDPMKKWPHARLRAFGSLKYDASEWMFNTISDARNLTTASGCNAK